ncbi:MAG: hypothetical protein D6721_07340 [Gammaproteobacteria bacterium]|nr:MAG: hypothetical protein D6721_07340 [Gammaproteobacteria bacterium]
MTEETGAYLDGSRIDELLSRLQRFHASYGALLTDAMERRVLEGFRRFLEGLLEGEDVAGPLAREYLEAGVPFALLMASFGHLEQDFVRLAAAHLPEPVARYPELARRFEEAKREAARAYLVAEAERAEPPRCRPCRTASSSACCASGWTRCARPSAATCPAFPWWRRARAPSRAPCATRRA